LSALVRDGDIDAGVLADPRLGDTPATGDAEMQASEIDRGYHCSFVYVDTRQPGAALVYERPANGESIVWMLTDDGRVQMMSSL
jgi:hypothetical protein